MADILMISVSIIALAFTAFFILLPRYGPHTISRLTCPKCNRKFNYHWVAGLSFISLYRGSKRRLHCPYCHEVSIYEIALTKISKEQLKLLKSKT